MIIVLNKFLSNAGGGVFFFIKSLYPILKLKYNMNFQFYSFEVNSISEEFPYENRIYSFKKIFSSKHSVLHLHSIWTIMSLLTLFSSFFGKKRVIISLHGMLNPIALKKSKVKKIFGFLLFECFNLSKAFCLHALNDQEYLFIRKRVKKTPIAILPLGINLPIMTSSVKSSEIIKFLFLGRLVPIKGIENLIHAWKKLSLPNCQLVIAGFSEEGYDLYLKSLVLNYGIENSVSFYGPVFDLDKDKLFRGVDCYILPSLSEGIPTTVLEAWSYKLPVIMTPECNLNEGFVHNAAIKITSNPTDIANGIKLFLALSDVERKSMGEKGYMIVSNNYTWDTLALKYKQLYDWALGLCEKPDFVK